MDGSRFDDLTRRFAGVRSRRSFLKGIAGGVAAAVVGGHGEAAAQSACQTIGRSCDAGHPCCDGNVCSGGRCVPRLAVCVRPGIACSADSFCCPATSCAGGVCCPNLQACGDQCCTGATVCRDGVCQSPSSTMCPVGQTSCGSAGCRRLSDDLANCGSCGRACPASTDPCKVAVCQNGACGFAPANEGLACDDGNPCTASSTCRAGACVGTPRHCPAIDQCHEEGYCNPSTGQCVNPNKADGTICNDADACTVGQSCQGGVCTGGGVVVCAISADPCMKSFCDPGFGCVTAPKAPGTTCDDGNVCTTNDMCQAGICVGSPVAGCCIANSDCDDGNPCTVDTCDPATHTCIHTSTCGGNQTCDAATGACVCANAICSSVCCAAGEVCVEGRCRARGAVGALCDLGDAGDCLPGLKCCDYICREQNYTGSGCGGGLGSG